MMSLAVLFTFLFVFNPSEVLAFSCENGRDITTEKDQKIVLCDSKNLQVSKLCAQQGEACALIKDLAQRPDAEKLKFALTQTLQGTSGSRLCNLKGWTVLMGEMFDSSQVCTCKHPTGEFISCVSLDHYYRQP